MTVKELKSLLEDADDRGYGDMEVRLAMQPNWPMEYSIENSLITPDDVYDDAEDDEDQTSEDVVYLSESSQIGYLPGVVSKTLGWR